MHLARALARDWSRGDEIVVTELDHHGNVDPWIEAARDRGVTVRTVRMIPESGRLDWDDLLHVITPGTRLVAIGAASNALGTITDVARAVDAAHAVQALAFVDGVHDAPHRLPDVAAFGCDGFACSAYKFYGPHVGVLWLREDLLARARFPRLVPAASEGPERAETGTLNHEGIVGAAAAVEWLAALAGPGPDLRSRLAQTYAGLHARSGPLLRRMWEALSAIPGVRMYGPPPDAPRTPTLAFTVEGLASETVARSLADAGVFVSHGDFYAYSVVARLGLQPDGLVRAGCACYTSESEADRLVSGVAACAARPIASAARSVATHR